MKTKKCECGETVTKAPLVHCRECEICGCILHNQYEIIYHPNCEPKGFKDRQAEMDGKVWKACVKPGEDNE